MLCSEDGSVYSWGEGQHGALGLGTLQDQFKPMKIQIANDSRIAKIDCGREHSVLLDVSGRVYVAGSNKQGQLGLGEIDPTHLNIINHAVVPHFTDCSKQVACGDFHTLVMSHSGLVYSAGENN